MASLGATSHRDFKRLAASLANLDDGGVVINLGSAVILPEVFVKALNVARNLDQGVRPGCRRRLHMQRHYRPQVNVVERPTGRRVSGCRSPTSRNHVSPPHLGRSIGWMRASPPCPAVIGLAWQVVSHSRTRRRGIRLYAEN
jgi:hypothetical protein